MRDTLQHNLTDDGRIKLTVIHRKKAHVAYLDELRGQIFGAEYDLREARHRADHMGAHADISAPEKGKARREVGTAQAALDELRGDLDRQVTAAATQFAKADGSNDIAGWKTAIMDSLG